MTSVPGLLRQDLPLDTLRLGYRLACRTAADEAAITLVRARMPARMVRSGDLLDVIPPRAGKGPAARFVLQRLGRSHQLAAASGDSGNDLDLLHALGADILVGNADADVRVQRRSVYRSPLAHARGVLDGLQRLYEGPPAQDRGVVPDEPVP